MDECDDFRVVCAIAELKWSDFEVRVDCEPMGDLGRTGRRLISVFYKPSDWHRSYRAGTGNQWMSAFEEDAKARCFTSHARKSVSPITEDPGLPVGMQ